MKTEWDYTDRAHTYDARADYSDEAIRKLLMALNCEQGDKVADIGAGTGKLTKLLLAAGMEVSAVEPNDNMRMYGKKNTEGQSVNGLKVLVKVMVCLTKHTPPLFLVVLSMSLIRTQHF